MIIIVALSCTNSSVKKEEVRTVNLPISVVEEGDLRLTVISKDNTTIKEILLEGADPDSPEKLSQLFFYVGFLKPLSCKDMDYNFVVWDYPKHVENDALLDFKKTKKSITVKLDISEANLKAINVAYLYYADSKGNYGKTLHYSNTKELIDKIDCE